MKVGSASSSSYFLYGNAVALCGKALDASETGQVICCDSCATLLAKYMDIGDIFATVVVDDRNFFRVASKESMFSSIDVINHSFVPMSLLTNLTHSLPLLKPRRIQVLSERP